MVLSALVFATSTVANATPSSLSYQGRIVQADGTPLEYQAVLFEFTIMDPSGQYAIYKEISNAIDMRNSGGVFDVPIGVGLKTYPDSSTGNITYTSNMSLLDAFNNNGHFYCKDSGANANCYAPLANDARVLRVQFFDGGGWRLISPDSVIRSVPFAGYSLSAQKLGTNVASDFVLKNDVNNAGSGSVSCDSGNFLTWDASAGKFGCAAVSGASGGTVTDVTASSPLAVTNGTSTPNITIQVASGSQNGYLSSSDWTTFNNKLGASSALSGDVSGTPSTTSVDKLKGTALSISSLSSNQVLKYSGGNWINSTLATSDISGLDTTLSGISTTLSSAVMQSQFPASCAANQTLTFVSPSGSFSCSSIAINGSQVSGNISGNAAGFTGSLAGDVSGTQSATSVDKIKGVAVAATTPTNNQVLTYTGGSWTPADLPSGILSGAGTAGYVPYYNTSTTLANSSLYYDGSKIGIGTTSPVANLDIGDGTSTSSIALETSGSGNNESFIRFFTKSDGNGTATANNKQWILAARGDGASSWTPNNLDFTFWNGTSWAFSLSLSPSGNVGIGTTTPTQTLDVAGNIKGTQLCIGTDCRSAWPGSGGGGTVTSVTGGTGLTGGTITGSGTLAVDVGTTANKIVQLDASGKLPAVDGSALTNLNASNLTSGTVPTARMPALTGDVTSSAGSTATTLAQIQGKSVTISSLATGDYLKYNGTAWINDPLSSADLSDSSSLIKSSQMPANCAAGQTLTFSSPTGAWTCSNIVVTASNFGSQTQNTFLAAPNGSNGTPTFRAIASADLPSGTLSGSGTAGYVPYYNTTSTLANSNIYNSSGNVGIGTASPQTKLDVVGSLRLSGSAGGAQLIERSVNDGGLYIYGGQSSDTTPASLGIYGNSNATYGGNIYIDSKTTYFRNRGATTNYMTIADGGNVGIGTTSPSSGLHVVETTGGANSDWYDPANYAATIHQNINAIQHYGLLVSDRWRSIDNYVFAVDGRYTNGSGTVAEDTHNPYFIVRGDGKVGIGTTNPGAALEVKGSVKLSSGSGGGVIFADGTIQTTASDAKAYGMAYRTTAISLSGSTYTTIALDGGDSNLVNVTHSTSTNPSRILLGQAGTYRITYSGYVANSGGAAATMCGRLMKNGSTVVLGSVQCASLNTGWGTVLDRQLLASFSANDYIEFQGWANLILSFATTTTSTNETPLLVTVERIGP